MKILLDIEGKVNYDKVTSSTTVKELLDAIDMFLIENPLSCGICNDSCCKKTWAVEMDNVSVNTLCNWDDEAVSRFIRDKLVIHENIYREFEQYIMKKETNCNFVTETNLCTIYEQRPIICRLFICSSKSHRYSMIRELIGSTYLEALVIEEKIRNNHLMLGAVKQYMRNPAVFTKDYGILLDDIFRYALEEGWLYTDEMHELYLEL